MVRVIPPEVPARRQELEVRDAYERALGLPTTQCLQQVAPDRGRVLALMAAAAPAGIGVETGPSGSHSTLWIALGANSQGKMVLTVESDPQKCSWHAKPFNAPR